MLLVCGRGAADPGGAAADSVSDPARPRRPAARLRARRAEGDDAAGGRARRHPAAAPLRVGVLHGTSRAAAEPAADLAARGRTRRDDDGRCGRGRACGRRSSLGGGVRPRRGRVADRSDRGHCDREAARGAATADRHHRGREPRQRRDGARAAAHGDRRRCRGVVLALGRRRAARAQHRRRDRRRPRRRLRDPPRSACARQPAARGDDRLPDRLLRVPAGVGARRLGRARGRHRRRLHGLVHARADDGADAPAGPAGSGRC